MPRGDGESGGRSVKRIGVPVATGARQVHGPAREKLVQAAVRAVLGHVHALGLGYRGQIHFNTRGGNRLSGQLTRRGRGLLQIEIIDAQRDTRGQNQADQGAHVQIINLRPKGGRASAVACGECVIGPEGQVRKTEAVLYR